MKFNKVYNRYVTKSGLVFTVSKKTGKMRLCKISCNSAGYPQVSAYKNKMPSCITVHRLVWLTYKGDVPEGFEIDHIDNDKLNPSLDNLQLLTHQENVRKIPSYSRRTNHK